MILAGELEATWPASPLKLGARRGVTWVQILPRYFLWLLLVAPAFGTNGLVEESTSAVNPEAAYTYTSPPVTDLAIGWPEVGHLYWHTGRLEFKSKNPSKAAKEFFDTYLKNLVDRYIAERVKECKEAKKK